MDRSMPVLCAFSGDERGHGILQVPHRAGRTCKLLREAGPPAWDRHRINKRGPCISRWSGLSAGGSNHRTLLHEIYRPGAAGVCHVRFPRYRVEEKALVIAPDTLK